MRLRIRLPGEPPFVKEGKKDVRSRSIREEKHVAAVVGGKTKPNSGAGRFASSKGDIEGDDFLIEHKMTEKPSIRVGCITVEKICREAALVGKRPAIAMTLVGLSNGLPTRWVAIRLSDFVELTGGEA